jgi:hypothetical protein
MYLPSVEVLKVLGYRNSKDVVFTERNPEQKLFLYVIINAIEDVLVHQSDRKSSFIKCENIIVFPAAVGKDRASHSAQPV